MDEQTVRRIILEEIKAYFGDEKYIFSRLVQFLDGRNMLVGRTTGTQIGTATDEKLAFHGSTPVIQRASANQAAVSILGISGLDTVDRTNLEANLAALSLLSNEIRTVLIQKGIMKGSA